MTLGLNKETLVKLLENEGIDVIGGQDEPKKPPCGTCCTKPPLCDKKCKHTAANALGCKNSKPKSCVKNDNKEKKAE